MDRFGIILSVAFVAILIWWAVATGKADEPGPETVKAYIRAVNPFLSSVDVTEIETALRRAAKTAQIPLEIIIAVAEVESSFRADPPNPYGAEGIMQVKPIACHQVVRTFPHLVSENMCRNLNIPKNGALAGALYLRWLYDRGFSEKEAFARYGGGEIAPSYSYAERVTEARNRFVSFLHRGGATIGV